MRNPFDQLDEIADVIRQPNPVQPKVPFPYLFLSTHEHLYVCLAANRVDLVDEIGFTVQAALARLGPDWTAALVQRHKYQTA